MHILTILKLHFSIIPVEYILQLLHDYLFWINKVFSIFGFLLMSLYVGTHKKRQLKKILDFTIYCNFYATPQRGMDCFGPVEKKNRNEAKSRW